MNLASIPKHAWIIITPLIIVPLGYLILMMGYLLYSYAQILPNAKSVSVKIPNIEVVTELVDKQLLVNEQLQNTLASTQSLIENTISHYASPVDSAPPTSESSITQLKNEAAKLHVQQEQLKVLKTDLIRVKTTIQKYEPSERIMDDQKPFVRNLQK